jgi:hypothetical protein
MQSVTSTNATRAIDEGQLTELLQRAVVDIGAVMQGPLM